MKIKNISEKIIGIGEVTVLPGETRDIPKAYERSPILEVYKKQHFAEIMGKPSSSIDTAAGDKAKEQKMTEDAEVLRQARLASLDGITEEALASLANELGVNPAECKDHADVLKKVRAALKK